MREKMGREGKGRVFSAARDNRFARILFRKWRIGRRERRRQRGPRRPTEAAGFMEVIKAEERHGITNFSSSRNAKTVKAGFMAGCNAAGGAGAPVPTDDTSEFRPPSANALTRESLLSRGREAPRDGIPPKRG